MGQTPDEITQNLAERLCWESARRDDSRVARRLYRKQLVDGVYRLDQGAWLDDFLHFLQAIGVMALREEVQGAAIHRAMLPCVPYVLRYGMKTLWGMQRINALPRLLFSAEALMPLVGFNAQQVRQGLGPRGATKRQGERLPGPIGPDTLAKNIVTWHLRDLELVFNGAIRALAKARVVGTKVTGMADGTDLETTERDTGCGQVTRAVCRDDTRGQGHAIEVTVYGWTVCLLIDAATKMPLAVKVGQIQAHAALWARALSTQARMHVAGYARRHTVVFDRGVLDGTTVWWLAQQGLHCVVPAQTNMAVTADARAQAAAEEDLTVGHRVHTVRHGQGQGAWSERLETEVVGITGLTTSDQDGSPEQGRQQHRRDFQPHPINAVVVRQWRGKDDGPGGKTVFLTTASVAKPLPPFDDDDDRRLIEHGCIKAAKPQGDLGHPPQKTDRAVRIPVMFTLLMFALATAYRLACEREARGGEPVGWQRWRHQLLEQTRDLVSVFAQGYDGIFPLAESSRLLGVKLKDVPADIDSLQQVLVKYGLTSRG
jgi:hypothetical protein